MLKKLTDWFQHQVSDVSQIDPGAKVELATAVLMFEIMRADDQLTEDEWSEFRALLKQHFHLQVTAMEELVVAAKQSAAQAVDFQEFTRVINRHCEHSEKVSIVEMLWKVAHADEHIDAHESHLIRRISDLLHIPHSQYIQAKLKVIEP